MVAPRVIRSAVVLGIWGWSLLAQAAEPIHLTVVGTNDLHGWVYPHTAVHADGSTVSQGGLSAFAGYLKILRDLNPKGTLLVDAGDLFQGTLVSNRTEGALVIELMNRLGYVASALGNHEFDYGPVGPASIPVTNEDPLGALKSRIEEAGFPFLAVNLYEKETHQRPPWLKNDGTLLLDIAGVRVGIFGLITPSTPSVTQPANVRGLNFGELLPEARAAAVRLREKGASVVIALAHAGGKCGRWENPRDISSCDLGSEVFRLLEQLPPHSIDAIVAGHTHATLGHFVHGVPVIESAGLGRSFGVIDLYVDPVTQKVLPNQTTLQAAIPICAQVDALGHTCDSGRLAREQHGWIPASFRGRTVVPDARVQQRIEQTLGSVASDQGRQMGVMIPRPLTRRPQRESALGNAVTDALREMEGADVAVLNNGALRADLPAGELRYGNLYEALPFDNRIATLTLTGEQLSQLMVTAFGTGKARFQQSGLKIALSPCAGPRVKQVSLESGERISLTRRYKVVMPDFLARGGSGLASFMSRLETAQLDFGEKRPLNLRDAVAQFWSQKRTVLRPPPRGRTVVEKTTSSCAPARR